MADTTYRFQVVTRLYRSPLNALARKKLDYGERTACLSASRLPGMTDARAGLVRGQWLSGLHCFLFLAG